VTLVEARSAAYRRRQVTALERLRYLAATDPAVAPMAVLQVQALDAAADPIWERGVPEFESLRLAEGVPLLHETTLKVDGERAGRLLRQLASAAAAHAGARLEDAVASDGLTVQLIETSIVRNTAGLRRLAEQTRIEINVLATLGSLAAVPLLQAVARRSAPLLASANWDASYCPVCGAAPTLAELRGLERERWLRCGRCCAGWLFRSAACAFCGCADPELLGYLAPDAERDTPLAETCRSCGSYLKTVATLGPLQPDEVFLRDIDSVELDMAALQKGYTRPARQVFALTLRVAPLA
jgi:FdhE protein